MTGKRKADANITGPGGQPRPREAPAPTAGNDIRGTSAQTAGRTENAGGNGTSQALAPVTAATVNVIGLPGASSMSGGALDRGGGPRHEGFSPPHGCAPPTPTLNSPLGNPAGGSAPYAIHAPTGYGTGSSGQNQIASPRNTGTGQPHGNSGGPSSPICSPAPAMAPSALGCLFCGASAILVFARVPFCEACYRYAHTGNAPPQRAQIRHACGTQGQLGLRLRQASSAAPEQQPSSRPWISRADPELEALDDALRASATILNNPFTIISAGGSGPVCGGCGRRSGSNGACLACFLAG